MRRSLQNGAHPGCLCFVLECCLEKVGKARRQQPPGRGFYGRMGETPVRNGLFRIGDLTPIHRFADAG